MEETEVREIDAKELSHVVLGDKINKTLQEDEQVAVLNPETNIIYYLRYQYPDHHYSEFNGVITATRTSHSAYSTSD